MKNKQKYIAYIKLDDFIDLITIKNNLGKIEWTPVTRSGADAFKVWNGYLKGGFPSTARIEAEVKGMPQFPVTVFDEDNIRIECGESGTFTDENQVVKIIRYNNKFYEDFPFIP